jgi:hypothetical protein
MWFKMLGRGDLGPLRWLVAAAVVSGCSDGRPERVPVSGIVLIDGQPLTRGYIRIIPTDARAAGGEIGADGRFTLGTFEHADGCVVGMHAATVFSTEPLGGNAQRWLAPKKYADPATSGLTVDIKEATDALVINLTWAGGKPFIERFTDEMAQ